MFGAVSREVRVEFRDDVIARAGEECRFDVQPAPWRFDSEDAGRRELAFAQLPKHFFDGADAVGNCKKPGDFAPREEERLLGLHSGAPTRLEMSSPVVFSAGISPRRKIRAPRVPPSMTRPVSATTQAPSRIPRTGVS